MSIPPDGRRKSPRTPDFWARVQQIPRYYVYLLLAGVVVWQILFPILLPISPSAATRGVEEAIKAAPNDKLILISTDWDASTQAETGPQTAAIIEACLRSHKRFALLTLGQPAGAKLANDIAVGVARRYDAEYGVQWANWGYKYGTSNVLLAMVKDIPKAIGVDFYGGQVSKLAIMQNVRTIKDIGLVVEVTGLAGMTEMWIGLIQGPYQVPFTAGYTAVMAPGYYPFLDSGQIRGMLVGAKGAAEMEVLLRRPGMGMAIMSAQSWAHLLIILLIVVGNVGYIMARRGKAEGMSLEVTILWAAAIATLGVYSILYRENPVSRLFEHIFVGLAAGYMLVTTWTQNLQAKWWTPMVDQGRWYWIFAPIVGLLFYFIYSRRLSWMARVVMGLFFGVASGVFFREFFPLYSPQVWASFKPLRPEAAMYAAAHGSAALAWWDVLVHNWLFVIILLTVMSYFFFSVPHTGKGGRALGRSALVGRWFLMIAFGAMFGNTVMARLSLFIGRVYFLLGDWLGHYISWLGQRV